MKIIIKKRYRIAVGLIIAGILLLVFSLAVPTIKTYKKEEPYKKEKTVKKKDAKEEKKKVEKKKAEVKNLCGTFPDYKKLKEYLEKAAKKRPPRRRKRQEVKKAYGEKLDYEKTKKYLAKKLRGDEEPLPPKAYNESIDYEETMKYLGKKLKGDEEPLPPKAYNESIDYEETMKYLGGKLGGSEEQIPTYIVSTNDLSASSIFILNNYAYIASENILSIYDISDKPKLQPVGSYDAGAETYINDVVVLNELANSSPYGITPTFHPYAYLAVMGDGMQILDVGDPSNPILLGVANIDGNIPSIATNGREAYIAARSNGVLIFNVEDKTSPYPVGSFVPQDWLNFYFAYIAPQEAPTGQQLPEENAFEGFGQNIQKVSIVGNQLFALDEMLGAFQIDRTDPTAEAFQNNITWYLPYAVPFLPFCSYYDIAFSNDYTFFTASDAGIIFQPKYYPPLPPTVVPVVRMGFGNMPGDILVLGNYLYLELFNGNAKVNIYDISDIWSQLEGSLVVLEPIKSYVIPKGQIKDMAVSGDYIYVIGERYVIEESDVLYIIDMNK